MKHQCSLTPEQIPVICIMGPTATGKTDAAAQLYESIDAEIISVDSSLVYSGMDIGTAKPDADFLERYPHHLVNVRHPNEVYSVADFFNDSSALIRDITERGKMPVLAGGTMFYFNALEQGLTELPKADEPLRARITEEANLLGWPVLHQRLAALDPQSAQRIDSMDAQRIQRALEIVLAGGKPVAEHNVNRKQPPANPVFKIALSFSDRAVLHDRIAQRFDIMLEAGLESEVRALLASGVESQAASMVWVSDPQISPDSATIAYVVNRIDEAANRYASQIWVVASNGETPPRPLTAGEHRDSQPRWSPDGASLAFTSTRAKDDKGRATSTLHLLPFDRAGETVLLGSGIQPFVDPVFSPDGTKLAVTQRVRGPHYEHDDIAKRPARKIESYSTMLDTEGFVVDRPRHVHVVATDGTATLRDITPGPFECSSPAWLGDGNELVVEVNTFSNDFTFEIGVIAADPDPAATSTEPRMLTDHSGWYGTPVVSPNLSQVLISGIDDTTVLSQNGHLGLVPLHIEAPTTPDWRSTTVDRTWTPTTGASAPVFLDHQTVLASYEDRGNVNLVALSLAMGETQTVVSGDSCVTAWSAQPGAGHNQPIAFTATTATRPAELYVVRNGEATQLTYHTRAFTDRVMPRAPEHFIATSGIGDDAVEVDAWIITPHDFDPAKKYPTLLNIHGGPHTQYGNYFFDEFQMQAAAGYVVIYANPRGSSGREQAWGHAILGPKHPKAPGSGWGGVDYDDVMAVTDAALEQFDFINPTRLGVLGGSYGGYMTSWILTHSDRFAAGCSERSANNLLTLEYASDLGGFFFSEIGPRFVDDPDEYLRMSPITYIKSMNTPLLIVHSENDLRCPVDQAWQMFNAATMLEKDVEFWLFPGESHELSRSGSPAHRIQRQEIILDFFDRRLSQD